MKRFMSVASVLVLLVSLSACKCPAAKNSVTQIKATHDIVGKMLLEYVAKDATLTAKEKERVKSLVDEDRGNIDKLEKALED